MPNFQLMPRRRPSGGGAQARRWVGLGDYTDFNSLVASVPQAQQAWQAQVAGQLVAENAPAGVVSVAQSHFFNAWSQLSTLKPVLGTSDLVSLGNAAASLAFNNNTIAGAGQLVSGLVEGATRGNPAEIAQAFSGTLVSLAGAAVAAGSISFGAGAAIIIGIELATTWVESLFQATPAVATICGAKLSYQPGIIVNCAWTEGQPVVPGSGQLGISSPQSNPFWRRFPEPSNQADVWWFTPGNGLPFANWSSGKSSDLWYAAANAVRPIDAAFPQYHQLECDVAVASAYANLPDGGGTATVGVAPWQVTITGTTDDVMFARFILAYFGAWKANAEYLLNGQASAGGWANDAAVLMHMLPFWNSSHQTGSGKYVLTPRDNKKGLPPSSVITYPSPCGGTLGNEWWYVSMLLNDAGVNSIAPNTGAAITPALASPLVGTAQNTGSTLGSIALGTAVAAGVAAGSLAVYSRVTRQSYTGVLKALWGSARGLV